MCVLPLKTFLRLASVGDDGFLGHVLSSLSFRWKSNLRNFLCSRGHYAGRRQAKSMNIVERLRNLEWSPNRTEYHVCWKDVNIGSYCGEMQYCMLTLLRPVDHGVKKVGYSCILQPSNKAIVQFGRTLQP